MKKLTNKLVGFANYAFGLGGREFLPSQIALEVSSHCNLQCTICPHGKMQRPKGNMSLDAFRRYIDDVKDYVEFVYLYGIGESLLCRDLPAMIDYAHDAGIYTYLSTNAMLLDAEWTERLFDSKLDSLTFAIDGYEKSQYERIRVNGNFDTVIENIRRLLRRKRERQSRLHITLQLVLVEGPDSSADEGFRRLFPSEEWTVIDQVRVKPFYDSFPDRDAANQRSSKKCFYPWNFAFVYNDGRVGLCCVDYDADMVVGDLNRQSLREIWNGQPLQSYRQAIRQGRQRELALCKTCSLPETSGFHPLLILASAVTPTKWVRRCIPWFERWRYGRKSQGRVAE